MLLGPMPGSESPGTVATVVTVAVLQAAKLGFQLPKPGPAASLGCKARCLALVTSLHGYRWILLLPEPCFGEVGRVDSGKKGVVDFLERGLLEAATPNGDGQQDARQDQANAGNNTKWFLLN